MSRYPETSISPYFMIEINCIMLRSVYKKVFSNSILDFSLSTSLRRSPVEVQKYLNHIGQRGRAN